MLGCAKQEKIIMARNLKLNLALCSYDQDFFKKNQINRCVRLDIGM